jgi:hypothetical protein
MRKLWLMVGASLLAIPCGAGGPKVEPTRGPVKVFVTAKAAPGPVTADELKAREEKANAAFRRLEDLEKEIKSQYKGDQSKWPAEKLAAYYDALYENNTAWTQYWFAAPDEKSKSESADDVRGALGAGWVQKKGWLVLADARDNADLVLEVVGRYGQVKWLRGGKSLACDLLPGQIGIDRLSKIPVSWPFTFGSAGFTNLRGEHWFKPDAPFFRFGVSDPERWRDVAGKVPWVLNDFIKENYEVLKPAQ